MNVLEKSIRESAMQSPERLAIQWRTHCLSYGGLAELLETLDCRVGPVAGLRVVLLLPDGLAAYLCHLYLFVGAAIVTPASIQTTSGNLKALCERLRPHLVVTNALLRARHAAAFESLPALVVKASAGHSPWRFEFDLVGGSGTFPSAGIQSSADGDLRLIVFTSGSTGEPKGVCLGACTILAAARMNVACLSLDGSRKSLVTVPLYDYYGFIQIYSHILAPTGYILGESVGFQDSMFQRILSENVTDLVLVPHTLRQLLKSASSKRRAALQSVKVITSSSDALSPEVLDDAFDMNPDLKIVNIYGLTEAGRASFRIVEASSAPSTSIGRPAPGVEIEVAGTKDEPGEIIIRGPNVMLGYFQEIRDDNVVFKPCCEMRTGDLGYYDEHGEIMLLGRRDHMFNIKGAKIHPVEIEGIALQCPGVVDAQARTSIGTNGEIFILLDVVPGNETIEVDHLRTHMQQNLPPIYFPKEISVVDALKRTELGGKIVRR